MKFGDVFLDVKNNSTEAVFTGFEFLRFGDRVKNSLLLVLEVLESSTSTVFD